MLNKALLRSCRRDLLQYYK